ncbi:AraC family transcriptional regulator [Pseudanabaena sp. FACHB-2040]|uniref:AraC family transcriptional regulator n=1 Tax=Pseudanabaena sp. FACHB-2040 TaxID=2692859 RepID=UPI0016854A1D|nr:AraC family transcriptional regulator [Pseudanabaena sp. FACHB-2040]MBD2260419.1 AraC family transcriptional regulator [Pseudanabaena sp. FACHB-2040]
MEPQPTQEQVKFWQEPALQGLELLRAHYITHRFSRHTHEGYAIGVIESGVEAFAYRGSAYQAPAGSLVVIHPGEVHTGHAGTPGGWVYRMVYPQAALVQQVAQELSLRTAAEPFFPQPVIQDPPLAAQFCRLHQVLEQSPCQLERESGFWWMVARLIQRHGEMRSLPTPPLANSKVVNQLQIYLQERYSENIALEDLAQLADLPPLKLLRVFRRVTGLPPHAYLIQVRVNQAKRRLAKGQPIVEVAMETGFADQSHLNRHFKRLVGVTPGQYARGSTELIRLRPRDFALV